MRKESLQRLLRMGQNVSSAARKILKRIQKKKKVPILSTRNDFVVGEIENFIPAEINMDVNALTHMVNEGLDTHLNSVELNTEKLLSGSLDEERPEHLKQLFLYLDTTYLQIKKKTGVERDKMLFICSNIDVICKTLNEYYKHEDFTACQVGIWKLFSPEIVKHLNPEFLGSAQIHEFSVNEN